MRKTVFGLAKDASTAHNIINALLSAGANRNNISVLSPDLKGEYSHLANGRTKAQYSNNNMVQEKVWTENGEIVEKKNLKNGKQNLATENTTKGPEGAATGATIGGILGGTLGLLAGIGSLAIPGLGPFIAAGPIMAALGGSAVGGSLGLLVGGLVGLGIPEYEAKNYETGLKNGKILISADAQTDEEADRFKQIFKDAGAESISSSTLASSRG